MKGHHFSSSNEVLFSHINLTSQVLKCFFQTTNIAIDTMARCNSKLCEAQITQATKESFEPLLGLNLTQVPRPKEQASGRQVCLQVEFQCIT
jgi:hypothetical protein